MSKPNWEEIASSTITRYEKVPAPIEEFYRGLLVLEQAIKNRLECAAGDEVDLRELNVE